MTGAAPKIKQAVRDRYARAARRAAAAGCCGPAVSDCCSPDLAGFGASAYHLAPADVPEAALLSSLGCGNPTAIAGLRPGDRVLDLGSGGGLDVFLAARRVGPTGFVYGVDMTDEMLSLARANQAASGITNVEFRKGEIEALPLPDAAVDVIISNCVINLSTDKPAAFREARRVLVLGGRFAVSDVVARQPLSAQERGDLESWAGCLAGALTVEEYRAGLTAAGFHDIAITLTHQYGPTAASALITALA